MNSTNLDIDSIDEELSAAILSAINDYEEEIRLRNLSQPTNKWRLRGRLSQMSNRIPTDSKYKSHPQNSIALTNNYRRSY